MYKNQSNLLAAAVLIFSLPLAGCTVDSFEDDQAFEPYGGSKQHPIKVARGKAYVEGCGDWSENVADTAENGLANNHGCAVQSNIAAMAAYPADLAGNHRKPPPPLGDIQYYAIQKITAKAGDSSSSGSDAGSSGGGTAAPPK